MRFPPQLTQEVAATIASTGESMDASVQNAMKSNFLVSMVLGTSAQELFAMIRQLQWFFNLAMVDVPLPGNLLYFLQLVATLSEVDVTDGQNPLTVGMRFKGTSPFNPAFDAMGTPDMNFFNNTGPMTFYFVFALVIAVMWMLIGLMTRVCFDVRCCRRLGMRATTVPRISYFVFKFIFEAYMELLLASILGVVSIFSTIDSAGFMYWFVRSDDAICSAVTIVTFLACLAMPPILIWLMQEKKTLSEKSYEEVFGTAWEDYNILKEGTRKYITFCIMKRLVVTGTIITLDGFPF